MEIGNKEINLSRKSFLHLLTRRKNQWDYNADEKSEQEYFQI